MDWNMRPLDSNLWQLFFDNSRTRRRNTHDELGKSSTHVSRLHRRLALLPVQTGFLKDKTAGRSFSAKRVRPLPTIGCLQLVKAYGVSEETVDELFEEMRH
jgi:hypothetical protein